MWQKKHNLKIFTDTGHTMLRFCLLDKIKPIKGTLNNKYLPNVIQDK